MYGELKDLVPKRFAAASPSSTHDFAILSPLPYIPRHISRPSRLNSPEETYAYCELRYGRKCIPLLISDTRYPRLADAVFGLASLPKNGHRPAKYLDLYKILERLGGSPSPDHTALRHAFAHSPQVLARSSTVHRLQTLFGSVDIDWGNTKHQRTFWRLFGEVLVNIDLILERELNDRLPELSKTS